jgi:type IV pilus assembly protein PilA
MNVKQGDKMKNVNKQAGFSLVELMVVVAIIGVLASVAIPSFNKFQRRARAVEGKTALSSLYESQKSFLAEWEDYSSSMAAIGYTFEGNPRTEVDTGEAAGATGAVRYVAEATVASAATLGGGFGVLSATCGNAIYMPGCQNPPTNPPLAWGGAIAGTAFVPGVGGNPGTFIAAAATNVGGSLDEVWSIDQVKTLVQIGDGINSP